eukprot:140783_1
MQKAKSWRICSNQIKSIKCIYDGYNSMYGIKRGESMRLTHILSIILYTDYDTLSYNFSCTFRGLKGCNKEYGNWSKYLIEAVNCYGTPMCKSSVKVLYHGVSFMYFNKFIAKFNSPTSTTTKLQVATIFAKNNGVILDLVTHDGNLRYFNCSFLSSFPNEEERLFIQPPEIGY